MNISFGEFNIKLNIKEKAIKKIFFEKYQGWTNCDSKWDYQVYIKLKPSNFKGEWDFNIKMKKDGFQINFSKYSLRFMYKKKTFIILTTKEYITSNFDHFPFFMCIFLFVLNLNESILLHASSVLTKDGEASVFAGESGMGKTTIATLSQGLILNDDTTLIRRRGLKIYCYGNKLGGKPSIPKENIFAPLSKIFFLSEGRENRLKPLPKIELMSKLIENDFFFLCFKNQHPLLPFLKQEIKNIQRITELVKGYEISYPRDYTFPAKTIGEAKEYE